MRGMIDSYENERLVNAWWSRKWKVAQLIVAALAAIAVIAASILQLAKGIG